MATNPDRPVAVYAFAGIGFLFFGALSHDFPPYAYACLALAVICIFQAYYQTFVLWLGILVLYLVGVGIYGWILLADLIKLVQGRTRTALLDLDDSVVFVIFVALLLGVAFGLLGSRPTRKQVSDV